MRSFILTLLVAIGLTSLAFSHTLAVPFFSDNGGNMTSRGPQGGNASFIGLLNVSTSPVMVEISYAFPVAGEEPILQEPRKFLLGGSLGISWRPFKDDPAEGIGRAVPGVFPDGSPFGSATISWQGGEFGENTINGRFVQFGGGQAFAHVIKN